MLEMQLHPRKHGIVYNHPSKIKVYAEGLVQVFETGYKSLSSLMIGQLTVDAVPTFE